MTAMVKEVGRAEMETKSRQAVKAMTTRRRMGDILGGLKLRVNKCEWKQKKKTTHFNQFSGDSKFY